VVILSCVFIALCQGANPFQKYTISNNNGLSIWFIPFGATMTHLFFPDSSGTPLDIICGYDDPTQYSKDNSNHPYFGAIIGRYANRIANGSFSFNNYVYHLPLNDGNWDTLHGGDIGYDRRVWNVLEYDSSHIVFQLYDGELVEAFPGDLNVTVTYRVTAENTIMLDFSATTSLSTIVNLALHTYWNLNGFKNDAQTILDHTLNIGGSEYTPTDSHLIPTGQIEAVPAWLDFRLAKTIGKDLANGTATPNGGYDNNLVLDHPSLTQPVLRAYGPVSGIHMDIYTTQLGLQLYTGNNLDGRIPRKSDQIFGGQNQTYQQFAGFAAETQHYPDSIHQPQWPTTVLNSGETYHQTTLFQFYH